MINALDYIAQNTLTVYKAQLEQTIVELKQFLDLQENKESIEYRSTEESLKEAEDYIIQLSVEPTATEFTDTFSDLLNEYLSEEEVEALNHIESANTKIQKALMDTLTTTLANWGKDE